MRTHRQAGRAGRRTTRTVLALLSAVVVLSGCGGGSDEDFSSAEKAVSDNVAAGGNDSADSEQLGDGVIGADGEVGGPDTAARVRPAGRDIVYRGSISVRVKNVTVAANRAESLTRAADGVVFAEETSNAGSQEESSATLTLRVPPTEFRSVLKKLAGLGKRLSQSQTAEDVTTTVVDTTSRVASQQRSVARVRALLGEADTIGEVVQVEAELAKRESDLESLEAQLARLKDVTELATIEVSLVGPDAPEPKDDEEDLGFVAGLRGGWDAFVQIVLVSLTVLGALLPFMLTGALLGVPLWLLLRSRLHRPAPTPPAA